MYLSWNPHWNPLFCLLGNTPNLLVAFACTFVIANYINDGDTNKKRTSNKNHDQNTYSG